MKSILTILSLGVFLISCNKSKEVDAEAYNKSKETVGYVYYKNNSAILASSAGSGHDNPQFKTRYNAIAATQLDANGKVVAGSVFPEGSFIVKDLYDAQGELEEYAYFWKNASNEFADSKGWVMGVVKANGKVKYKAAKKGGACIDCHSQSTNIDYALMNSYFP